MEEKQLSIAFLYAGQGSQKVGMGKDLYDNSDTFKKVVDSVDLDFDVKTLMFEGPMEMLSQTRYTQPCMAVFAAGVTDILYENGIRPDYAAGLSLGEYSALYSAGVFDEQTFIKLVSFRGYVMDKAAQGIDFKMSAVMGLDDVVLEKICEEVTKESDADNGYVTVSNYNCKGQYVICGDKNSVEIAEERAIAAGAKRCVPLKVSGPFHTKYMKEAGDELRDYFKNISFGEMKFPVIFNTTAKELGSGESIPELLEKQVQSSIHMEKTIELLKEKGIDTIIEIGPGKALSGFVKKTVQGINTYKIENIDDVHNVIEALV